MKGMDLFSGGGHIWVPTDSAEERNIEIISKGHWHSRVPSGVLSTMFYLYCHIIEGGCNRFLKQFTVVC